MRGGFSNKVSGTGLGLSICRHCLARTGDAGVGIETGQGTTVTMSSRGGGGLRDSPRCGRRCTDETTKGQNHRHRSGHTGGHRQRRILERDFGAVSRVRRTKVWSGVWAVCSRLHRAFNIAKYVDRVVLRGCGAHTLFAVQARCCGADAGISRKNCADQLCGRDGSSIMDSVARSDRSTLSGTGMKMAQSRVLYAIGIGSVPSASIKRSERTREPWRFPTNAARDWTRLVMRGAGGER